MTGKIRHVNVMGVNDSTNNVNDRRVCLNL